MGNLSSNLDSIRKNRALRRAEAKALRKKASIESKAQLKADKAAKKIRERANSKDVKKARKKADKVAKKATKNARAGAEKLGAKASDEAKSLVDTAKTTASGAKNAAVSADKGFAKRHKGAVELDIRKAKIEDKVRRKQLKQEAKLEANANKRSAKDAKLGRAHERKLAELELQKIEKGKINKDTAKRYVGFASVVLPVVAPLALKGISSAQAARGGQLSANPATALDNRISSIRQSVDKLAANRGDEADIARFSKQTESRLNDLATAVESAESVPTAERRNVHKSISGELDRINRDVLARLGVKA